MKFFLVSIFQFSTLIVYCQLQPINSGVYHWNELTVKKTEDRESRKILEGSTTELEYFEVHATTQYKGAKPKPMHSQIDKEEIVIIKEGTMKCKIGDKTTILNKNSVLLIPPTEEQYFGNLGDGPLTYYVFMYKSKKPMDMERSKNAGSTLLINADSLTEIKNGDKSGLKYFNRPTAMCENFEMHITNLYKKMPSHNPHIHVETEIILVLEGATEMTIDGVEYTANAGDFYIAESGKMHGIANALDKPCSFFAFKWR
jgi:mannose-6-phosphate isomerase-like protein (cupin superfamily)